MAEWRQIELAAAFDSELSRRKVMFVRAGSMITYPSDDQEAVDEVLRMASHSLAIDLSAPGDAQSVGDRVVFDSNFGARSSVSSLSDFLQSLGEHCKLWFYLRRSMVMEETEEVKGRITVIPNSTLTGIRQHVDVHRLGFNVDDELVFYVLPAAASILNPSGAGVCVFDDARTAIAEIGPCAIALLMPLSPTRHLWGDSLLLRIFERAIPLALNSQKWAKEFEDQKRLRLHRYKDQYVELVKRRSQQDIESARIDLTRMRLEKDRLMVDLTTAIREIDRLDMIAGGLNTRNGDFDRKARMEFDKICTVPEIVGLAVDAGGVKAVTTELLIDNRWRVGSYEIAIQLDGHVSIRNLTNAKKIGYETIDHPHVRMNTPCWGNIQAGVVKMISNYDFGAVLQTILEYLKTYNPDDPWGKEHIPLWKDDEVKREEAR